MPSPTHVPRVNNNDDQVRIVRFLVAEGATVVAGEMLAEIETDKSVNIVESEHAGTLIKVIGAPGELVEVGAVLAWIGEPGEAIPESSGSLIAQGKPSGAPTAKARELLARYGLRVEDVPASGDRLSAEDIARYVRHHAGAAEGAQVPASVGGGTALPEGMASPMSPEQRGMVQTVSWHRAEAVAGYVEVAYQTAPWDAHAAKYAAEQRLLMPPLLPLMARRLVRLVAGHPRAGTTIVGDQSYRFAHVNVGFTVQAGETLLLAVVREAEAMDAKTFIASLGELQRRALGRRLQASEMTGSTVAFSSMARWGVRRHIPILPPYCSMMVAHTAPDPEGSAILGASYDHRVLTGADVVLLLQALSNPEVW